MSVIALNHTGELDFLGRGIGSDISKPTAPRHRCLIIAELGINHDGDVAKAHRMIDEAKACGVDVVKLQKRALASTYSPHLVEHPNDGPVALAHYIPMLKTCELPMESYPGLKKHAEDLGLGFLVTPFDLPSLEFLERLGVGAYKVASCDAANPYLLRAVAATGKPFIVSTGMTKEITVFSIVEELKRLAEGRFALMHAVSSYPVAYRDCNLHMIVRYKHAFGIPVGWSGHERGVAVSVAAAAMGADVIERHFTLDRTAPGTDHAASLEPDGLKKLVERVRAAEEAYGDPYMEGKGLTRGEIASQEVLGKSLVAARDIAAGEAFGRHDLEARSPGRGLSPAVLLGREPRWIAQRAIVAGERLQGADIVKAADVAAAGAR